MPGIDRRMAITLAGATGALVASAPVRAQRQPIDSDAAETFRHGGIANIQNFGAVGDYRPGSSIGRDNAQAIETAIATHDFVYIPSGAYRFTGWPILERLLATTWYGPGQLYFDDGKETQLVGAVVRVGISDAAGFNGSLTQGGIVVGGQGPGRHGSLLYAAHPSWPMIRPTRSGSTVEFQIYSYAHIGAAKRLAGTNFIEAVYGDYRSSNVQAGDIIGFGNDLCIISEIISPTRLRLAKVDGTPLLFDNDEVSVYRHSYYYGEGTCYVNGSSVSRIDGDYFFDTAVVQDQKWLVIDGRRHRIRQVLDQNSIELFEQPGINGRVPFILKMLPLSLHVSLLRIQGLSGGSEENFSICETIDGFIRLRANGHGHGTFRPIVFGSGPDSDFGYHTDHLTIDKNGQIGLGKNYASPSIGFPTAAKMHVWRDGMQAAEKNGTNDVRIAVFETNHGGPAPRQLHIGSRNNYHAGYIQGYVDPKGEIPGPVTLNPSGGSVGINTGSDSALTHALEVEGAVAPHSDGKSALGAPAHRWSEVYSVTGVVQTSDAGEKQDARDIPDDLIDAFLEVEPKVFRWRASVAEKGDSARHHLGYVAQEIAAALTRRGLDPAAFGLWCQDELTSPLETLAGSVEQRPTGTYRQALRYDQLLALIDAANRRRLTQIEDRLRSLEDRL
jgi:hypothetical protein